MSYRRGVDRPSADYEDAVEEALCWGWIDSKGAKLDDERTMLLFTPRNPRSGWSRTNKVRVERLLRAGLIRPAGRAAIEAAKANGSWSLLDAAEALEVPADLAAAFAANPAARRNYDAFPPGSKKNILTWVTTAKRPETRARRVAETVSLAAQNLRANQERKPER